MHLPKNSNIFFIGIGGSGMKPLAEIALDAGYVVSGSDRSPSSATESLKKLGIQIFHGHSSSHITSAMTIVISSAIKEDNPELQEARIRNLQILHRSDLLSYFFNKKIGVAVCGTHGKTTTSSMIVSVMKSLGLNPSYYVGGNIVDSNRSGCLTDSPYFVAETDESDGTFKKYIPKIIVLTNIAKDHLDYFGDEHSILLAFANFIQKSSTDCKIICCWDDKNVRSLVTDSGRDFLSYGFSLGSDLRILEVNHFHDRANANLLLETQHVEFKTRLLGSHNILNATASLGVTHILEQDIHSAISSIARFSGVERRLQCIFSNNEVGIYDDYAHNPDKIRATVTALVNSWQDHRIHVVFQPHRYSRLKKMYNDFISSFYGSYRVYILPTYTAGEEVCSSEISSGELANEICEKSQTLAVPCRGKDEAISLLRENLCTKDIVVSVGAGDVNRVTYGLKQALEKEG